jgi:hypothetical protein
MWPFVIAGVVFGLVIGQWLELRRIEKESQK